MYESGILEKIKEDLFFKFELNSVIDGNYILIDEFNEYIVGWDTYKKIEDFAITVVDYIRTNYNEIFDVDYIIMDNEYELKFEVII